MLIMFTPSNFFSIFKPCGHWQTASSSLCSFGLNSLWTEDGQGVWGGTEKKVAPGFWRALLPVQVPTNSRSCSEISFLALLFPFMSRYLCENAAWRNKRVLAQAWLGLTRYEESSCWNKKNNVAKQTNKNKYNNISETRIAFNFSFPSSSRLSRWRPFSL